MAIVDAEGGPEMSPQTSIHKIREAQSESSTGMRNYVLICIAGVLIMIYGVMVLVLNVVSFVNGLGGSDSS